METFTTLVSGAVVQDPTPPPPLLTLPSLCSFRRLRRRRGATAATAFLLLRRRATASTAGRGRADDADARAALALHPGLQVVAAGVAERPAPEAEPPHGHCRGRQHDDDGQHGYHGAVRSPRCRHLGPASAAVRHRHHERWRSRRRRRRGDERRHCQRLAAERARLQIRAL
uniref:Uncharacterized protein n=1 Tax=Arundo donax TaxID=35708 RepID=A0A0A9GCK1_ARUDO